MKTPPVLGLGALPRRGRPLPRGVGRQFLEGTGREEEG